jgi:ceramide glucosyltransferase
MAWLTGSRVLRDSQVARWLWLLPVRDFIGSFIWLASFAGHTISWRGDSFKLQSGRLVRIDQ